MNKKLKNNILYDIQEKIKNNEIINLEQLFEENILLIQEQFKDNNYFAQFLLKHHYNLEKKHKINIKKYVNFKTNLQAYLGYYYYLYEIAENKELDSIKNFYNVKKIIDVYSFIKENIKDIDKNNLINFKQKLISFYYYNYNKINKYSNKNELKDLENYIVELILLKKNNINTYLFKNDNLLNNLLDSGLNPNDSVNSYKTSFLSAYLYTNGNNINKEILQKFKNYNANPNIGGYNGTQAYLQLLENNYIDSLKIFLEVFNDKIDYNFKNAKGHNFLQSLIKKMNQDYKTIYMYNIGKVFRKYQEVFNFILENGNVDLTIKSGNKNRGTTVINYIKKYCEEELGNLLIDKIIIKTEFENKIKIEKKAKLNKI